MVITVKKQQRTFLVKPCITYSPNVAPVCAHILLPILHKKLDSIDLLCIDDFFPQTISICLYLDRATDTSERS